MAYVATSYQSRLSNILASVEARRIKKHLRNVHRSLSKTNDSCLSAEFASRRRKTLQQLDDYIEQAQFPINNESYRRHPIFVDSYGNRCAMGYLLHANGRDDLVDEVSANDNLVQVEAINDQKYLNAFAALGLTKEHAAQIQPGYGWMPPEHPPAENEHTRIIIIALYLALQVLALFFVKSLNMTKSQKVFLFLTILLATSLMTFIGWNLIPA